MNKRHCLIVFTALWLLPGLFSTHMGTVVAGTATPTGKSQVESIYNEKISSPKAERIVINELELARDALRLLVKTNWDYENDKPLPISVKDFDQAKLKAYVADERKDDQELTIPAELEPIYLSKAAATEISALVLQARREYLDLLKSKGIRAEYINEIDQYVLPADPVRLIYHPENDPNAPPTAVGPSTDSDGEKNYGRLQMDVYPVDIYNGSLSLEKSRVLGETPKDAIARLNHLRKLRDMSLRHTLYHEMTHVLQRAYIHLHAPARERDSKSAAIYADKTLDTVVDTQYHWKWGSGEIISGLNNRHVSDESQADGIAHEFVAIIYNMSPQQKASVWDHLFGRLEMARDTLNEIKTIFATHYPEFVPDNFGSFLADAMEGYSPFDDKYVLIKLAFRLSSLPAYVGYMNPMRPEDTGKFWAVLREL